MELLLCTKRGSLGMPSSAQFLVQLPRLIVNSPDVIQKQKSIRFIHVLCDASYKTLICFSSCETRVIDIKKRRKV